MAMRPIGRSRGGSNCRPKRAICLAVLALAGTFPGWPQSPGRPRPRDSRDANVYAGPQSSSRNFVRKFTGNVLLDQEAVWTSPFHIRRSSAKWWIMAGVGTAALLAADHPVSQALPASGSSLHFGTDASRAGQWYSVFPAAGAFYALGLARHNPQLEQTGAEGLEAMTSAIIVTSVLKVAARRQRPLDGDGGGHFEKGGSSFPSGHSTEAWALATVVAGEYGEHKWVPYASYGYAALVSTSRVLAQAHFTSDVFVGGALGFFIGRYVVRTQKIHREHLSSLRSRLLSPRVSPSFSPIERAVTLTWTY